MNIVELAGQVFDNQGVISNNNTKVHNSGYDKGKEEGVALGYEEGYLQSESDFWDAVQDSGNRDVVEYMFCRWGREYIRPKYKVVYVSGRILAMFSYNSKLKKVEKGYFDLSTYTPTIGLGGGCVYSVFYNCPELEEIEDIGIQAGSYYYTFNRCRKLHTIEVMRCTAEGRYDAPFSYCYALQNITTEGEIGNDISFKDSSLLTIKSLMSIINALVDYSTNESGTTHTLTLHPDALARLSTEQTAIATSKGWTVTA